MTKELKNRAVAAAVAVVLVVGGFALGENYTDTAQDDRNQIAAIAYDGRLAHDALCASRVHVLAKVERTRRLMRQNPGDLFGIPRALIKAGLGDDLTYLRVTRNLDC